MTSQRTLEEVRQSEQFMLDLIDQIGKSRVRTDCLRALRLCGYKNICPMWKQKFKELRRVDTEEVSKIIADYIEHKNKSAEIKYKLEELQDKISQYMDQEGVDRVFGENGIIARTLRKTYKYDEKKLREILEPLDKWEDVLKVDGIALRNILGVLPYSVRKEAEKAKVVDKETKSFIVKKK